jgi:hypothetical protein
MSLVINRPSSIPSETSIKNSDGSWLIHNFEYDKNTTCYLNGEEISPIVALNLLKEGHQAGTAYSPLNVVSSEFTNRKEVIFTGTALIGMAITWGLTILLGKD